jgi:SAM-dependent methyltransferase
VVPGPCDLCGGLKFRVLPRRMTGARRTVICQRCGLVFTNPRWDPVEIARLYVEEFRRDPAAPAREDFFDGSARELELERDLAHGTLLPLMTRSTAPKSKRWLEVRFRTGAVLEALQDRGAEVHGVDLYERGVGWVRERLPAATLHVAPVHDLLGPVGGGFDVISMTTIHVTAHVPSPTRLLSDAFDRLVPGGLLMLAEKDITRMPAYVPQFPLSEAAGLVHYHHLTENSLRAFVEKVGFEIVQTGEIPRRSVLRYFMIVARKGDRRDLPAPAAIRADDPEALYRRVQFLFLRSRYRRIRYRAVVGAHRLLARMRAALKLAS